MPIIEPEFMDLTADLDVAAWWEENAVCEGLGTGKPRCSASFSPDDHWIFEFMAVPSTLRYYQDHAYRNSLHREVNALTRTHVGRAFFDEDTWRTAPRRIENLFGCEFGYHEGSTPWLIPVVDGASPGDADEFARVLDRAEATDLRTWSLQSGDTSSDDFLAEWEQRQAEGKPLPKLGTGSRGPATIMTSILKPETLFFWFYDHPDLMRRFRDLLADKMIEFNRILRDFYARATGNEIEPGWWITDDNCALFNRRLYREYCYPVLERVLAAMAPGDARRYQHSDSAMGHLLDMQYELGIRDVNYGPTVDAGLIREKMPAARINGQTPPMLLRDGSPAEIRARVLEDFRKAGGNGRLNVTTAGSLAAGTGVGRMRWYMQTVQQGCRYDVSQADGTPTAGT